MLFRVGIILAIGCITSCVSSDMCQVEDGASYRGKVAVTNTGKTCQRWDSQTPHGHTRTPANYPSSGLEQNYCRNPDGEPGVWCYTVDPYSRWELCDVPICGSNSSDGSYGTVDTKATYTSIGSPQLSIPACRNQSTLLTSADRPVQAGTKTVSSITCQVQSEASYRGKVAVTNTGKTCQRWDSQTPHVQYYTPGRYPSSGLDQNYCRNPDGASGVWCYTVDPSSRWEYCDVPKCVSSYRDQHNKTSPPFKTVDGYGCPSGYTAHGRACFKAYNQVRTYVQARRVCAEDGGLLAMPKNKDLDNFLRHLKNDVDRHSHFWFGLNDQKNEGEWMWEDGSLRDKTADWNDWRSGQPDDHEGLEDCAHYHSTEGWNDIRCNATFKFICQLIPGLTTEDGSCEAAQVTASFTFVGGPQFSSSAYWDQSALQTTTAQAVTNMTAIVESYTEEMTDEVTYQLM